MIEPENIDQLTKLLIALTKLNIIPMEESLLIIRESTLRMILEQTAHWDD